MNLYRGKRKLILACIVLTIVIIFILLVNNINIDGVKHVLITDENGSNISNVLVIPLYSKSTIIGFGPNGNGFHTKERLIISKLFMFNSGENIIVNKLSNKGVFLPPLIFIGRSNYLDKVLFVKKGYTPKLANRADIYSDVPIIMTIARLNYNYELYTMLLDSKHNQNKIKMQFGNQETKDNIEVIVNNNDVSLSGL